MNIITCPNCGTRGLPKADGTCPSCHATMLQGETPSKVQKEETATHLPSKSNKKKHGGHAKLWVAVGIIFVAIIILSPPGRNAFHSWSDSQTYWDESKYWQGERGAIYLDYFARGTSLGLHQALLGCGLPEKFANVETLKEAGIEHARQEPVIYSYQDGEFFMFSALLTEIEVDGASAYIVSCSSYKDTNRRNPPIIHVVSWQETGEIPGGVGQGVFTTNFSTSSGAIHFEIQVRNSPSLKLIFTEKGAETPLYNYDYGFATQGLASDNISIKFDRPKSEWSVGTYIFEILCSPSPSVVCSNDLPLYSAEYTIK